MTKHNEFDKFKIGRLPTHTAQRNITSWGKINNLLIQNGTATYSELIATCKNHQHVAGGKGFVNYCIDKEWLVLDSHAPSATANSQPKPVSAKPPYTLSSSKSDKTLSLKSGLYIVTLTNTNPISVNAIDKRIADTAIKATSCNCKIGKAVNFDERRKYYYRIFGEHLQFKPLVIVDVKILRHVEKIISAKFNSFKVHGKTGRKNEWMQTITPQEVVRIVKNSIENDFPECIWCYTE